MRKLTMVIMVLFSVLLINLWTKSINEPGEVASSYVLPIILEKIDAAHTTSDISSTLSQVQVVDISVVEGPSLLLKGIVLQDLHGFFADYTEQTFLIESIPDSPEKMISAIYSMDICFIYALVQSGLTQTVYDRANEPIDLTCVAVCDSSQAHFIPIEDEMVNMDGWNLLCSHLKSYYIEPFESVTGMENIYTVLLEHSDPNYSSQYYEKCNEKDRLLNESLIFRYETAIKRRRNLSVLYGSGIGISAVIYCKLVCRKRR